MIRYEAARRLAAIILHKDICIIEVTPQILDVTAEIIIAHVNGDESKQLSERIMAVSTEDKL
jgi:hypothetical protein